MDEGQNIVQTPALAGTGYPRALRVGLILSFEIVALTLVAALTLPKGMLLAAIGDSFQVGLVGAAAILAFRNLARSRSRSRIFWFLVFLGNAMWLVSLVIWTLYELWFARAVPDSPVVDILLFVKLVPFAAAVAIEPHARHDSRFRAFGPLDVCILMLYSLYLYAFAVFAYRLLPGATETYNYHFSLADTIGNQIFMLFAAVAVFRTQGPWRGIYRMYFFAAACYGLASDMSNVAIDVGRYYTGSLYDVPLIASMAGFVCLGLAWRPLQEEPPTATTSKSLSDEQPTRATCASSRLAMVVTLSIPVIGLWLLSDGSSPAELFSFRLQITLLTIFLLTLFLSIKQDLLTTGLMGSLRNLSETYVSINRFKTHLNQSEKLASLGELVADLANQIKGSMTAIREASARITSRPDSESRIQAMAGKIAQYARRTDELAENMLRFAQETPLQFAALDVKPLIESALHLSRAAKRANIRVEIRQNGVCPPVRGDSSQLLHVLLQIISNAIDALEEVEGGTLDILIRPLGSQVNLEFADSGPGIKEPERVFEPFYTTKPVGKGTGLGLSTCYGILQQHDGVIFCKNRVEGGALFSILLPAMPQTPSDASGAPVVAEALR